MQNPKFSKDQQTTKKVNTEMPINKIQKIIDKTHQTAPDLKNELRIGNNDSWNEASDNDGVNEQAELNKNVKKTANITVIERDKLKK